MSATAPQKSGWTPLWWAIVVVGNPLLTGALGILAIIVLAVGLGDPVGPGPVEIAALEALPSVERATRLHGNLVIALEPDLLARSQAEQIAAVAELLALTQGDWQVRVHDPAGTVLFHFENGLLSAPGWFPGHVADPSAAPQPHTIVSPEPQPSPPATPSATPDEGAEP